MGISHPLRNEPFFDIVWTILKCFIFEIEFSCNEHLIFIKYVMKLAPSRLSWMIFIHFINVIIQWNISVCGVGLSFSLGRSRGFRATDTKITSTFVHSTDSHYMVEILPIRRKTLFNPSITLLIFFLIIDTG